MNIKIKGGPSSNNIKVMVLDDAGAEVSEVLGITRLELSPIGPGDSLKVNMDILVKEIDLVAQVTETKKLVG